MTDQSRGARVRRGARRPGWLLLTVLLVLAIGASSALVFTNRVELLKLAVILALWAAVAAAFVSVIYRRQSDIDQAKVRDLKLVYDLQLDREISARREYELTVETQLRRELTSEIRAGAADEVAGLRAELAALRANLEILFDADLSHRPAIEHDRSRAYSDWPRETESAGRVTASRIDTEDNEDVEANTDESPIIDVPAEPHVPDAEWPLSAAYGGAHRRQSETEQEARRHRREVPREWSPPQPPPKPASQPTPQPQFAWQQSQQERPAAPESPPPPRVHESVASAPEWQPAPEDGEFIPAGAPGSNWVSPTNANGSAGEYVGRRRAAEPAADRSGPPTEVQAPVPPTEEPVPGGAVPPAQPAEAVPPAQPAEAVPPAQPAMQASSTESHRGKHSAPPDAVDPGRPPARPTLATESGGAPPHAEPADEPEPPGETATSRRHRSTEDTGGQSVADLLARLQAAPTGGGRRRRRDD